MEYIIRLTVLFSLSEKRKFVELHEHLNAGEVADAQALGAELTLFTVTQISGKSVRYDTGPPDAKSSHFIPRLEAGVGGLGLESATPGRLCP